ncbi:MAG: thiamine pyrophosphate-dependent enzyme [Candidatus Andersenbacteria bacterium]
MRPTLSKTDRAKLAATFDHLTPKYGFQWCPGCGNFGVLNTLKFMLVDQQMDPSQVVVVSDIGQAGKLPMWLNVYGFHGLHGRALPFAQGVKVANPALEVLAVAGDGGAYGEGMAHFVHACRRNVNLTYLVHDNATYALTTGQASPTSERGTKTKSTPEGSLEPALNPLQIAIASGATFVARAFVGDQEQFQTILTAAVKHQGFAVIDILQPCVIWNSVQTWQSWDTQVYRIGPEHNSRNKAAALALAEQASKLPIGILYQHAAPTFDAQVQAGLKHTLVQHDIRSVDVTPLLEQLQGRTHPDEAE